MRKYLALISVYAFLFVISATPLHARYVTVNANGDVTVHVLSFEDEKTRGTMEVTKLAEKNVSATPEVTLKREKDTIQMLVTNAEGERELHVPEKSDTLIEIEERPETQKLIIGVQADQFFLRENKYIALTYLPLTVDAQSAHLVATSTSGDTLLSVLPMEAAELMLRSGIVTKITDNTMQLLEDENVLQYKISGEKVFSLLHIYDYTVPVDAYVSVSDGSIERIDSSTWYRFMNFLVG